MELFDVLNENGNPTGKTKLRSDVHRDGDWHRSAHVWIMNSKGEVLIQKRSPNKDSHPNMWDISCAGHVTAGDDAITTATKELKEELGLEIPSEKIEHLLTVKSKSVTNGGTFINNEIQEVFLIKMDIDVKKLQIQKEELSDVKFAKLEDLDNMPDFLKHPEETEMLATYLKI